MEQSVPPLPPPPPSNWTGSDGITRLSSIEHGEVKRSDLLPETLSVFDPEDLKPPTGTTLQRGCV